MPKRRDRVLSLAGCVLFSRHGPRVKVGPRKLQLAFYPLILRFSYTLIEFRLLEGIWYR